MGYHAYQPFKVTKAAGSITLYPRQDTAADDLVIYANSSDTSTYLKLNGAGAMQIGSGVSVQILGSNVILIGGISLTTNANNDLPLTPDGTGLVKFGTHTALGGEALSGYITIKDAGGTTRKLGVIS